MTDTIDVTKTAATTRQVFDRTVTELKDGANVAAETSAKAAAELGAFGKDNVEAFVQAGQIFAAEGQEMIRQAIQSSQAAVQESMNSLRAIATAKSVKEGMELQANFFRTAAIWSIGESARYARAGVDLMEKAYAPIAARTYAAADKLNSYKA